jgi:hypothetical protein
MKTIISIILLVTIFTFTACSGGGGSSSVVDATPLVIGEEITVEAGDQLQTDENTVINVVHEVDSTTKKVTLLSGTATLIKGDYVLLN